MKSISGVIFFFGNLATGHFSGKFFSRFTPSGPTDSNDTGLKTVALPEVELIAVKTNRQTFLDIII